MEEEVVKALERVAAAAGEHVRDLARDLGADWGTVEDLAALMAQHAVGQFGYAVFSEDQERRYVERFKKALNCDGCSGLNPPALCRLTFKLWGLDPPCERE